MQNKQRLKSHTQKKPLCSFGLTYYLSFGLSWMLGLISITAAQFSGIKE